MGAVAYLENSKHPEEPAKKKRERIVPKGGDPFREAKRIQERKCEVKALKSLDEADLMVMHFLERGRYRDACLFVLGCNTALRIGDIVKFRWRNLVNEDSEPCETGVIIEGKTQKFRELYYNDAVREAVLLYKANLDRPYNPDEYVFISEGPRKGHVVPDWREEDKEKRVVAIDVQPLHTRSAARIIRNAAKELGLYTEERRISSHTMRKTALSAPTGVIDGVKIPEHILEMKAGLELAKVMGNHRDIGTTSRHYVGIEEHIVGEVYRSMNLGLNAIRKFKIEKGIW